MDKFKAVQSILCSPLPAGQTAFHQIRGALGDDAASLVMDYFISADAMHEHVRSMEAEIQRLRSARGMDYHACVLLLLARHGASTGVPNVANAELLVRDTRLTKADDCGQRWELVIERLTGRTTMVRFGRSFTDSQGKITHEYHEPSRRGDQPPAHLRLFEEVAQWIWTSGGSTTEHIPLRLRSAGRPAYAMSRCSATWASLLLRPAEAALSNL